MIRMIGRWRPAVAAFVTLSLLPSQVLGQWVSGSTASAPQAAHALHGLDALQLQTVYLLERSGTETSGKLLEFSADSVRLLVDGVERRFDTGQVARIQRRDSLRNGVITGAVIGLVMGLIAGGISDCPGEDPGGRCAGFRSAAVAISTIVYTGFGVGIDALIPGRTTVYNAPSSAARMRSWPREPAAVLHARISW
jgi:hypothetical protein